MTRRCFSGAVIIRFIRLSPRHYSSGGKHYLMRYCRAGKSPRRWLIWWG
ncbi:transposase [Kluyvera sp. 142359]